MIKKLFENFRTYLDEEQQLIESRLSDTKKKYPDIAEYIDLFAKEDPSGKNKYLQWFAKQLYLKTQEQDLGPNEKKAQARFITSAIEKFHKNVQRMPKKDIGQYKTLQDLRTTLDSLGATQKEKRTKEKETAMEGSDIVYQDDDFFIVRPNTTESSCYYGRGTKWCISATESRNYFNQYSGEGKVFYFLRNEHLPDLDPGKKIAFVVANGEIEEYFDAPDDSIDENEAFHHVTKNLESEPNGDVSTAHEAWNEITSVIGSHAEDNPPDYSNIEEEIERIKNEYNQESKHSIIDYDFDGDNIQDISMRGDIFIDLDEGFDWVDENDVDEDDAAAIINKALSNKNVHPSDIQVETYDEKKCHLSFSMDNQYGEVIDNFEQLAAEMKDVDEDYDDILAEIKEQLGKAGLITGTTSQKLDQMIKMFPRFKNIKVQRDGRDLNLDMTFNTSLPADRDSEKIAHMVKQKGFEGIFKKRLMNFLEKLNNMMAKQLELFENKDATQGIVFLQAGKFFNTKLIGQNKLTTDYFISFDLDEMKLLEPKVAVKAFNWVDNNHDTIENIFIDTLRQALEHNMEDMVWDNRNVRESFSFFSSWRKYLKG